MPKYDDCTNHDLQRKNDTAVYTKTCPDICKYNIDNIQRLSTNSYV